MKRRGCYGVLQFHESSGVAADDRAAGSKEDEDEHEALLL
jgi:hypothetical protein